MDAWEKTKNTGYRIKIWYQNNTAYLFVTGLLLAWYDIFLFKEIDLATADIGRYIIDGKIFWTSFEILKTNFYSYTFGDFSIINHHWAVGIIFYPIWKLAGFSGLSLFFIILSLLTFFIFFRLAQKISSLSFAVPAALLVIPLLGERVEIRPEVFSNFFAAIFFCLLWQWQKGRVKSKWLFVLPLISLAWINVHIYFFLGFFILALFWLEELIISKMKITKRVFILTVTAIASFAVSLINPFGIRGLLYPLRVTRDIGYRNIESQSIWFLEKLGFIHNPNFLLFEIAFIILIISFIGLLIFNRRSFSLALFGSSLVLGILAASQIRNFTLFGYFVLLAIAYNFCQIKNGLSGQGRFGKNAFDSEMVKSYSILLCMVIFVFTLYTHYQNLPIMNEKAKLGLSLHANDGAQFFKNNHLRGPIFNNFDIGGYLIYNLYSQEKVFVDNRPEAYPVNFFDEVYIPMQENDDIFRRESEKYHFNCVFFYLRDATPWGQKFLVNLVQNSDWAPVFVDDYTIIFLKRNDSNKEIIAKYEIPQSRFNVRQ